MVVEGEGVGGRCAEARQCRQVVGEGAAVHHLDYEFLGNDLDFDRVVVIELAGR